ncbi:hypothetical protein CQZ99_11935 [Pseudomonas poae]|uniref:Uncharacterized protein n=1 Tax=Pseudomonas poae TaxID=200451 RepID=A0A2S9ETE3_9PSED|nr:hypothetical protein CQZ97_16465 [Pseudomonas poae]PRC19016.1 hypothetical protein CQZ99_11935 [Pseudomonas poae]
MGEDALAIKQRALVPGDSLQGAAIKVQHRVGIQGDQAHCTALLAQHQPATVGADTPDASSDLQRVRRIHQHLPCTQFQAARLPDHLATGIELEGAAIGQLPGTPLASAGGIGLSRLFEA